MPKRGKAVSLEPNPKVIKTLHSVRSVNLADASRYLGVGERQVRRLVQDKKLLQVGSGKYKRIVAKTILDRLEPQPEKEAAVTGCERL